MMYKKGNKDRSRKEDCCDILSPRFDTETQSSYARAQPVTQVKRQSEKESLLAKPIIQSPISYPLGTKSTFWQIMYTYRSVDFRLPQYFRNNDRN